jgi:integrase
VTGPLTSAVPSVAAPFAGRRQLERPNPTRCRLASVPPVAPGDTEADPRLKHLIVAAVETGLRLGELLKLQWRDVGPRLLHVRDSKTGTGRRVPISARARAILDMRATSPTASAWPADAYVFGDGIGQKVGAPDRAWKSAVLRSRGIVPERTATKALTAEARAAYQRIDLTFHDLRHECGSRLLEAGMPLHEVSRLLGHANIATTSRYLNATAHGLLATMERIDAARAAALRAVANGAAGEDRLLGNDGAKPSAQVTVN